MKEMKIKQTINAHFDYVYSLIFLNDKKIASCSEDNTIRFYDPFNDFHCDQIMNRHNSGICSICQLDDGTMVSCSRDKTIIIGDYVIHKAHEKIIIKIITLPNDRIASCSWDNTIKIWKSNPPYSNTPIKILKGHHNPVNSLVFIKERDLLISGAKDKTLRLWNMSTYQCDTVIEGVYCCESNALYQIDNYRVIAGWRNTIYIVNIDKCIIEKTIEDQSLGFVYCFLKLRDNTILCGCDYGLYDINEKHYKTLLNNENNCINDLLIINDNTFVSCSNNKTIEIWEY